MMKKNKELEEMRHQAIVDKEWHHKLFLFYFVFIDILGKIQNNDLTSSRQAH